MSLRICSLSSGSEGNCILVASDSTTIIVDCGIPIKAIQEGLKLLSSPKPSLLITHCHSDHICSLGTLSKALSPEIFCPSQCQSRLIRKIKSGNLIGIENNDFFIGDITVSPFKVSHDTPCFGYSFYNKGRKISFVTDLGCGSKSIISAIRDSDLIFIEANHDEELLMNNHQYPMQLKHRILSSKGHLSNSACANILKEAACSKTKQIILGHLSQHNNYPELAHTTVSRILYEHGIIEGEHLNIEVVTYGKMSGIFEIV